MDDEKNLWEKLDKNLEGALGECESLNDLFGVCNAVLSKMRKIIGNREDLANKKPGVGVRGMRDILFRANLLGEDVEVDSGNFNKFCECLKAISELSRGGFLWIGSSALSKHTQDLCKRAGENLLKVAGGTAALKIARVGEKLDRRRSLAEVRERLEKQKVILKLVSYYEDQKKNVLDTNHNWPLVTNDDTIGLLVGCEDCYDGEFKVSVHLHGTKYKCREIYVYNQKCKNCGDGKDFDGPEIIRKLRKWSNNGNDTIVVEGTEEYQNERGLKLREEKEEKWKLVLRLIDCHILKEKSILAPNVGSWPLVVDEDTVKSCGDDDLEHYEGVFRIFLDRNRGNGGVMRKLYIYNRKCISNRTKKEFDGPGIIKKLNKWSSNGTKTVVAVADDD